MSRLLLPLVFSWVLCSLVRVAASQRDRCQIVVGDSLDDSLDNASLVAGECTDVLVLLGSGTFRLGRAHKLNGTAKNITVRSESEERVRISCDNFTPSATDAFLLEFRDWQSVSLYGLEFENCPRGISIVDVETVRVENSYFRNVSGGAVNIYDSYNVLVSGSVFEDCTASGELTGLRRRILGGGLSLSCIENRLQRIESQLTVQNCTFIRCVSSSTRLSTSVLGGRGGGLAFSLERANVTVSVEDSDFLYNNASQLGGAMVIATNALIPDYQFLFRRLEMKGNLVGLGGGALAVELAGEDRASERVHMRVVFEDCEFDGNGGLVGPIAIRQPIPFTDSEDSTTTNQIGGAILISLQFSVINVTLRRSKFRDNFAGRAGAVLVTPLALRSLESTVLLANIVIEDCVFANNFGIQFGTLTVGQCRVFFRGRNVFQENQGTAFLPILSLSEVEGELVFEGNTAAGLDGGAVYIAAFSQIQLNRGADLQFINNSGNLGAGLVVEPPHFFRPFSQAYTNPLCFLLFEDPPLPPPEWDNVSITFAGNNAIMGSGAFISSLELCSWNSYTEPVFDAEAFLKMWQFVHVRDNVNTAHTNSSQQDWAIQTPALSDNTSFLLPSNMTSVYPGEQVPFQIGSRDEYGKPAVSFLQLHTLNTSLLELQPEVIIHEPRNSTVTFTYATKTGSDITGAQILSQIKYILGPDRNQSNQDRFNFSFVVGPCPLGFSLQEMSQGNLFSCQCKAGRESTDLIGCEGKTLVLKDGHWGSSYTDAGGVPRLQVYPCPNSYCRCFDPTAVAEQHSTCRYVLNEEDPNIQCSCNRTGFLCGKCAEGNGITTTFNRCVPCSYPTAALIPALVIVDVIAVVVILQFFKYIPSLLYPALFYLQTVPYIIRQRYTLQVFEGFFYINDALSFYFPWDVCLFPGATALDMYGIRYTPFLVAVLVVCIQLIMRHVLRHRGRRVHYDIGLWPLTLLLFNHVVYTSMAIINCPLLTDYDGHKAPIWYLDGTVHCFTGAHIPLALFAIAVLVGATLLALLLLAVAIHPTLVERRSLSIVKVFFKHAVSVYKKELSCFGAVELVRRGVLILTAQASNSSGVFWHLALACVFFVYVYVQPYKKMASNILETLLLFLLILLQYHVENPNAISQSEIPIQGAGYRSCEPADILAQSQWFSIVVALVSYLPVLLAGVAVVLSLTAQYRLKVKGAFEGCRRRQRKQSAPPQEEAPESLITESILTTSIIPLPHLPDQYHAPPSQLADEDREAEACFTGGNSVPQSPLQVEFKDRGTEAHFTSNNSVLQSPVEHEERGTGTPESTALGHLEGEEGGIELAKPLCLKIDLGQSMN